MTKTEDQNKFVWTDEDITFRTVSEVKKDDKPKAATKNAIAELVLKHLGPTDSREGSHNQLTHGDRAKDLPKGWSLSPPDGPSTFSFGKKGEAFFPGHAEIPDEVKKLTGDGASGKYIPGDSSNPGKVLFDDAEKANDPVWKGTADRQFPGALSDEGAQEKDKKSLLERLAREFTDFLGITEKGQDIPEWAAKKYPRLKKLGPLKIDFDEGHEMEKHLQDLELMPDKLMDMVRILGIKDIHLGPTTVRNLDGNQDLGANNKGDYRMKNRSWDDVGGVYSPNRRTVAVGAPAIHKSGSASTALHEIGHFLGDALGINDRPAVDLVHRSLWDGLTPYYKGRKPGDKSGKKELVAETIAGIFTNEEETRRQVGDAFVDYLLDELRLIDHKGRRIT